jgi:hypothetical protein
VLEPDDDVEGDSRGEEDKVEGEDQAHPRLVEAAT